MKAIIFYFQLFTRIPINKEILNADAEYRNGIYLFWVFASLFAGVLAGIYAVYVWLLPPNVAWLFFILSETMLTGAFHHDALADTCDGVFSARTKDRMLEIMKDSRIGTNGVIALVFYYLLMVNLGQELLDKASYSEGIILVFATVLVARFGLIFNFWNFKYSGHTQGLGSIIVGTAKKRLLISLGIMALMIIGLLGLTGGIGLVMVMVGMWIYRHYIYKILEGMNGDTVGASALLSQLIFLLSLLVCS